MDVGSICKENALRTKNMGTWGIIAKRWGIIAKEILTLGSKRKGGVKMQRKIGAVETQRREKLNKMLNPRTEEICLNSYSQRELEKMAVVTLRDISSGTRHCWNYFYDVKKYWNASIAIGITNAILLLLLLLK